MASCFSTLLSVQSSYSLIWGTAGPERLLARAAELGYRAVAIADHAALYALPQLVKGYDEWPCRVLFGASFPLPGGRSVTALVEDGTGYANLCSTITGWHRGGGARRLEEVLAEDAGLLFLADDEAAALWLEARGAAVYWRLASLRQPPPAVRRRGIRAVVAPPVCMADAKEYELHRLLRAIARRTVLPAVQRDDGASPEAFLRAPEAVASAFAAVPEALRRAEELAERLAFRPSAQTLFPPPPAGCGDACDELRGKAYAGAEERYGEVSESVAARLDYELELIGSKGFAEYFLVVDDIVATSPRTCGRGSGAASLVNYCLGVTNVDPLKYDLMFERFLNPGRQDPPDIDIDFAWDERDAVQAYVLERYGAERAALVCNHLTFQPRLAVRETARAFGLSDGAISETLRRLPELRDEYTPEPVKRRGRALVASARRLALPAPWPEILRLAKGLLGLPRSLSLHCGGVVVVPDTLARHVPIEIAAKGMPMIQWEKDGTEDMGLVKIDLLGNRSLAVIRDAVQSVAWRSGREPDEVIQGDPAADPATQRLLAEGRSMGVFYVESPAMRLLQQKAGKGDFEHLVIHSSIIRPAANMWIQEYLRRLHGGAWKPLHPRLAGVFDETYGVPVYQEDVCKLAMALSGFDAVTADRLRKCLGKRDAAARLAAYKDAFYAGGRARDVAVEVLDTAWDQILSMTGYSFCKPHSASYAQVSYEAAYLKAHHPAHFMAAVLSNGGGYYSTQAYVSEALRLGLRFFGPDANASELAFREENGGVRVGLVAVSGLHRRTVDALLAARDRGGSFAHIVDFCRRVSPHPDDLRRLAVIGALDSLAPQLNRPQILWLATRVCRDGARRGGLFETAPRVPPLPPYSRRQRQEAEMAALGFLLGAHPLALHEEALRAAGRPVLPARWISRHVGQRVTLLGWPVSGKVVSTAKREVMEFFSFEDGDALYETVLFPQAYRRYARLLEEAQPFWVEGRVEAEWGACTVTVERITPVLPQETSPPPVPRVAPATARGGTVPLPRR